MNEKKIESLKGNMGQYQVLHEFDTLNLLLNASIFVYNEIIRKII